MKFLNFLNTINHRAILKYTAFAGLVVFLILSLSQARLGIIDFTSFVLGRSIDEKIWNAFLEKVSYFILSISLLVLLYHQLLKKSAEKVDAVRNALIKTFELIANSRRSNIFFAFALFATLGFAGFPIGLSMYSPDSWSYFELAKSVFSDDFYKFVTWRSYSSDTYSTSFPLGYPSILAVGQLIVGEKPMLAVWLNAIITAVTWLIIVRLCRQLHISAMAGIALACSLLLWGSYLEEVFSGRSIPVAMLLFLAACSLVHSRHFFLGGLFLGFAALMRFDYLVFALIFQVGVFLIGPKNSNKKIWLLCTGFIVGISPWVIYSLTHFGKIWISDNSWIAFSALPAFVLDFPAEAAVSASDQPLIWLARIANNILPLFKAIVSSAKTYPLLIMFGLLFLVSYPKLNRKVRIKTTIIILLICASFTPYLLTGYFDPRYFGLSFLVFSAVFIFSIELSQKDTNISIAYRMLVIASIVLNVTLGAWYIAQKTLSGLDGADKQDKIERAIEKLDECQAQLPHAKFIFAGDVGLFVFRYGATKNRPTAAIPSNFYRMTIVEKERYFEYMEPYVLIESLDSLEHCRSLN